MRWKPPFVGPVTRRITFPVWSETIITIAGSSSRSSARSCSTVGSSGFAGSFLCLLPIFATHELTIIVLSLAAAFFFAEIVIGPMWSIPMDIAGKYSGTASGLMNTGSALAAILSPLAFGYIADLTGDWHLPFLGSLGLLLVGAVLAFAMHPDIAFERCRSPAAPSLAADA